MINLTQNKFIEKIKKLNINESVILANNIVEALLNIHNIKNFDIDWYDEYKQQINYSLHKHGLTRSQGLKDYILLDFLNNNSYFIKDRCVANLLKNSSLLEITINDDLSIDYSESGELGDRLLDLVDLNIIAFYNRKLAREVLLKYFGDEVSLKLYKLFLFYTAKKTIDLIFDKQKCKNKKLNEEYEEIINFIFDSYEDFTIYKPKWLEKN